MWLKDSHYWWHFSFFSHGLVHMAAGLLETDGVHWLKGVKNSSSSEENREEAEAAGWLGTLGSVYSVLSQG